MRARRGAYGARAWGAHYTVRRARIIPWKAFKRSLEEQCQSLSLASRMPREKLAKAQRKQIERKAAVRRRQIAGALEEWHASAFENALEQFDAAARRLKLTEN